jgi:hypothetical protein
VAQRRPCIRLRGRRRNHVWSFDFVEDRTHECLSIRTAHRLKVVDVIDVLSDLVVLCAVPGNIRSDNGRSSLLGRSRTGSLRSGTGLSTSRRSPWENGYVECFYARLRVNCSTARSSTVCGRSRSSSRHGGGTTTRSGHMTRSATGHSTGGLRPASSSVVGGATRLARLTKPQLPETPWS